MTKLLVILSLFVSGATAFSQTVSPAVVQYTTASEGSFEIDNNSILPMIVTVEGRSFSIDPDGMASFRSLDAGIHLELSQTSLRVPPKQRRTVYYKASAETYPAWFTVYSNISGLPKRAGMNVVLSLPHTVYLLSKHPVQKDDLHLEGLEVKGGQVQATLCNFGTEVARVHELEVLHGKARADGVGFPLLPGGKHTIHMNVPKGEGPAEMRVKLEKLSMIWNLP